MQLDPADIDVDTPEDETMILNLGPSHPSTHGVLRVMVELDGETVLRSKPVVGYLHTGMEKTAEELMYHQGGTNVTRMDYLSPFFNELAYCLSVEELLDIEIPPRATWIRMLMCELNRISSHMLFLATSSADIGAINESAEGGVIISVRNGNAIIVPPRAFYSAKIRADFVEAARNWHRAA